jgi:hypothetical protein
MDPVTVAKLWMVVRPIRLIRNRRRAKRGLPPLDAEVNMEGEKSVVTMADGTTIQKTEPLIPARTTTKQGVVGYVAILPITQALQAVEFPWPWLNQLLDNDMFVQAITIGALVLWGRFFKTPSDAGKIL